MHARVSRWRAVLVPAAASVFGALATRSALDPRGTVRVPGWVRTNYRGAEVSLDGGAAAAVGVLAGAAFHPLRRPALLAGMAAALAGGYDDLVAPRIEVVGDKGVHGHLSALRQGRVSGGVVKVAVIGASSLLCAADLCAADLCASDQNAADRGAGGRVADALVRAVAVAGTANLVNLLDLRPGRAAKLALVAGLLATGGPAGGLGAAVAAAAGAALPDDLAERTMLGDLGANALGAVLGVRLAAGRRYTRVTTAIAVGALIAASERVSFSRVIDSVALLRRADRLGRAG